VVDPPRGVDDDETVTLFTWAYQSESAIYSVVFFSRNKLASASAAAAETISWWARRGRS
jgi:hypothetical protein